MNELFQIYKKYKEHSDKGTKHSYIDFYEGVFIPYKNKEVNLLEVGVWRGASLNLWNEYFTNAKNIVGIDIDSSNLIEEEESKWADKITFIQGDSRSLGLSEFSGFDIIIDDGDHFYKTQLATFDNLYSKLNPGGVYIIEDMAREGVWRFLKYHEDLNPIHLDFKDHRRELGRHCLHNQLVVFTKP